MNSGEIAQLDKDIARAERELSSLHNKRLRLLERERQVSAKRVSELEDGSPAPAAPVQRSAATKKVASKKAATKKGGAKKKAATKRAGGKRQRMSSAVIEERVVGAIRDAGSGGISQIAIANKTGVKYPTVAKKLKDLKGEIVKKGKGKDTRYFLK